MTIVLVGLVALIAGAVTGVSVWMAVPATFVAIFAISYSAVLRGRIAAVALLRARSTWRADGRTLPHHHVMR